MTTTQNTIQIKDPKAPATPAQISYLASLVTKHDLPATCERAQLAMKLGTLTKGTASKFINDLKAAPLKAAKPTPIVVDSLTEKFTEMVTEVVTAALTEVPPFGYYQMGTTLYHWDITGKDVKPTLRRLHVVTNYDGSKKGSWKKTLGAIAGTAPVKVTATYTPYNGKGWTKTPVTNPIWIPGTIVKAVAEGIKPLTQAEAAALGKAYTFCIRCGAQLTDPVSVANGIGPVCATYWS